MLIAYAVIGAISGITESMAEASSYKVLCKAAADAGSSRPERVVIQRSCENQPGEDHGSQEIQQESRQET